MIRQRERSGPGRDTRFKPGVSGNPSGHPRGERKAAGKLSDMLCANERGALVRAAYGRAMQGDRTLMVALCSRVLARTHCVSLPGLPDCGTLEGCIAASAFLLSEAAHGRLSVEDMEAFSNAVAKAMTVLETQQFDERLRRLEVQQASERDSFSTHSSGYTN